MEDGFSDFLGLFSAAWSAPLEDLLLGLEGGSPNMRSHSSFYGKKVLLVSSEYAKHSYRY